MKYADHFSVAPGDVQVRKDIDAAIAGDPAACDTFGRQPGIAKGKIIAHGHGFARLGVENQSKPAARNSARN